MINNAGIKIGSLLWNNISALTNETISFGTSPDLNRPCVNFLIHTLLAPFSPEKQEAFQPRAVLIERIVLMGMSDPPACSPISRPTSTSHLSPTEGAAGSISGSGATSAAGCSSSGSGSGPPSMTPARATRSFALG